MSVTWTSVTARHSSSRSKLLPAKTPPLDVPLALSIVGLGILIAHRAIRFPDSRHRVRSSGARASTTVVTTRRREATTEHKIGSREEWLAAREQLLAREKEHTRLGDELARQRRELPWVPVEKEYRFDTDDGEKALVELFDGRSQLLVYHFMFGPSYEAGCPVNSSIADTVDGVAPAPARA